MQPQHVYIGTGNMNTGLPTWCSGKESPCQGRRQKRHGFNPWAGKIPESRKGHSTLVLLPRKFQGQGAQRATVHGVSKSQKWLTTHSTQHAHTPAFNSEFYKLSSSRAKRASLIAQLVKTLPAMQETPVRFLGPEDMLKKV